MSTLVQTPYDQIAYQITDYLYSGGKTRAEIELEMNNFGVANEITSYLLEQLSKFDLITLNQHQLWKLTEKSIQFIKDGDDIVKTLISSFQFKKNIPILPLSPSTLNEESAMTDELDRLAQLTEQKIAEYNS